MARGRGTERLNVAAAIDVVAVALALYFVALSRRFSRALSAGERRWFAIVALAAAAYAAANAARTFPAPDGAIRALSAVQNCSGVLQAWGWLHYSNVFLRREPGRAERWWTRAVLAGGALALVPGVANRAPVRARAFAALAVVYREPATTPFLHLVFAAAIALAAVVLVRLVLAWRRGVPGADVFALSLGALLAMGANDALAAAGVLDSPYLLDIGFVAPFGALAWSLAGRFAADSAALAEMRERLEVLVEDRTHDLAQAQRALHQAEKLAALGHFAAGIAHEVNSPAAVITANLRYLAEQVGGGRTPEDAAECIRDAQQSMTRIAAVMRQLVDASRLATVRRTPETSSHAPPADEAMRAFQPFLGADTTWPERKDETLPGPPPPDPA